MKLLLLLLLLRQKLTSLLHTATTASIATTRTSLLLASCRRRSSRRLSKTTTTNSATVTTQQLIDTSSITALNSLSTVPQLRTTFTVQLAPPSPKASAQSALKWCAKTAQQSRSTLRKSYTALTLLPTSSPKRHSSAEACGITQAKTSFSRLIIQSSPTYQRLTVYPTFS
jgi:hypothetical protein